jgi:TP901 family phage tail tape measure protein
MSDTVAIRITATDGASGVFQKVGSAAETAGQSIERAGKSGTAAMDGLESSAQSVGQSIQTVGQSLAAFGGAISVALGFAAGKATAFGAAMANVSSISGQSGAALAQTTQEVRDLGVALGVSPTGMAEALYEVNSSGFAGAEGMRVLEQSTIAAQAGLTSTAVSGKALAGVLNAYSLSADQAGNVSDVLFKTVESGVITFEQLAANLGSTTPLAAQLGVSLEELGAAYAELTLQNISAAQAETAIAALMRSTIQETTAMTAAIQEYGFASAEALIQSQGLAGFLDFLAQASGGTTAGLTDLLGSAEATTAALALMRNEGDNFRETLAGMEAAATDGAYTQGVFATQTETTAFALQRLGAAFENAQIAFGNALTPLISMGADAMAGVLAGFTSLPGPIQTAAAALTAVTGAASLAGGAFLLALPKIVEFQRAMTVLGGARGIASVLGSGLVAAINPATVAIGGLTLAGVGLYQIFQNVEESASGVAEGVGLLADEVERLKLAAQPEQAAQVQEIVDAIQAQVDLLSGDLTDLIQKGVLPEGTTPIEIFDQGALNDQLRDAGASVDELSAHIIESLSTIPPAAQQVYLDWITGLLATVEHTAEGTNLDEIITQILTTPLSEVPGVMNEVTAATDTTAAALDNYAVSAANAAAASYGQVPAAIALNKQYALLLEGVERLRDAEEAWLGDGANILDFWLQYQGNLREATIANREFNAELDKGQARRGPSDVVTAAEAAYEATVRLAEGAYDAGVALDSVLRTFSQIDALGQRSEQAGSIAENLVGQPGEWATIDDLLANGRISLEQYNATVASGTAIMESNARVQEDLNVVRANQIPLLEQQQVAYEQHIRRIAEMTDAQQQQQALALQDAQFRSQVAEQYATAYAASLGEIPEEVATNLIVSAAEADPVLFDVLESMGLIEEGADGEIRVNFPDGPTVQESITELTASIDALTLALGGIPPAHVEVTGVEEATAQVDTARNSLADFNGATAYGALYAEDNASGTISIAQGNLALWDNSQGIGDILGDNADALREIGGAQGKLGEWDGSSGTATIDVNDNATGTIKAALGALADYAGRTATATITTNYVTKFSTVGQLGPSQATGGIPELATGGIAARLGELGPEKLYYATGGIGIAPLDRTYVLPQMTYVSPAHANPDLGGGGPVSVHLHIDRAYGIEDLTGQVFSIGLPEVANEIRRHLVAHGVS